METKITLHLVGDSTMCIYSPEHAPREGWGMRLPALCRPEVTVLNHAVSGCSTKSFSAIGKWDEVVAAITPGDYVVMGMGINDSAPRETRPQNHTDTGGEFEGNLIRWIGDVRARRGIPVFTTTTVCWNSVQPFEPNPEHNRYNQAILKTAETHDCAAVDLNGRALKRFASMQPEQILACHMTAQNDYCHLTDVGASFYARLFVELCQEAALPIASLFI